MHLMYARLHVGAMCCLLPFIQMHYARVYRPYPVVKTGLPDDEVKIGRAVPYRWISVVSLYACTQMVCDVCPTENVVRNAFHLSQRT